MFVEGPPMFGHGSMPRRPLTAEEWRRADYFAARRRHQMAEAARRGDPWPVGGGDMATAAVLSRASIVDGTGVTGTTEAVVSTSNTYAGSGSGTLGTGGFWYPGKSIRFWCWGRLNTGASASTMTLNMRLDSTSGASLGASAAVSIVVSQTNISWFLKWMGTCRSVGTSGTIFGMGALEANPAVLASANQPMMMPASAPATATIDTSTNHQLVFTAVFSATGHTMTAHLEHWETLN